jgi:hypothetical protein
MGHARRHRQNRNHLTEFVAAETRLNPRARSWAQQVEDPVIGPNRDAFTSPRRAFWATTIDKGSGNFRARN